ncbi:hypothetical protein O9993_14065 [Vibrio lentus]|nr:hypothetical protein [Vibrio lentus]
MSALVQPDDKALNSTSAEEREALYLEAEALMAKDHAHAPIYQCS